MFTSAVRMCDERIRLLLFCATHVSINIQSLLTKYRTPLNVYRLAVGVRLVAVSPSRLPITKHFSHEHLQSHER